MEQLLINEVGRIREELGKVINDLARIARILEDANTLEGNHPSRI